MKVFIIPSWYPSEAFPSTGIFFKEQAEIMAMHRPDWKVGISLWGSHEPALWIEKAKPFDALIKLSSKPPLKFYEKILQPNCIEFFHPAYTWTRKLGNGNIQGIVKANELNIERFILHFGKPDVIHAHVSYPAGFISASLSRKYGIPFLITEHMGPFPFQSLKSVMGPLILAPMKEAGAVLAVSAHLTGQIKNYGVSAQRATNFIDDSFFKPAQSAPSKFTFIYVGRLVKDKGLENLLDASASIKEDFQLKIVGSGPLEKSLKRRSIKLGLTTIEWLGECSRVQVRDEIRSSSALILPSFHENQPVSILEALACGKPVVATYCGGSEELVTKENGLLSNPGDVAGLTSCMVEMMTASYDTATIRTEYLRKHGAENVVRELENHYQKVISTSQLQG